MPFFLESDPDKTWVERNGELVWGAIGLLFAILMIVSVMKQMFVLSGLVGVAFFWSTNGLIRFRRAQGIKSPPHRGQVGGRGLWGSDGGDGDAG